jgi:hypothetical protein
VVAIGLLTVLAGSWVWLLLGAGTSMTPPPHNHDGRDGWLADGAGAVEHRLCVRDVLHVVGDDGGEMLPSAAPMLLLFARVSGQGTSADVSMISTGLFAAGYLLVWGLFSALAVA